MPAGILSACLRIGLILASSLLLANSLAGALIPPPGSPLDQQPVQNITIGAPGDPLLKTIGRTVQPGFVVLLENGNDQSITN